MLHALELENFKAFGKRARIPFAPITLIFGENSAGKSSILHALYLLKQTIESRESGALLLPRTENGIVDLGSFQEMLFDHDLDRTLSIRVETTMNEKDSSWLPSESGKIAIEFDFKRPSLEEEILLDQIGIYDGESAECIAKFRSLETSEEPEEFWERMGFFPDPSLLSFTLSKLPLVDCIWLTKSIKYWKYEFEWCKNNKEEILNRLRVDEAHSKESHERAREKNKNSQRLAGEVFQESEKRYMKEIEYLSVNLKLFSSDFDLETYISKRHNEEINTALMLQGFLPSRIMSIKRNHWITGFRSLFHRQSDNTEIFDVGELAIAAGRALEQTLDYLFPMSPFRCPPQRWYIFSGTGPEDVGYQGDLLPDLLFRRPELVKETDTWLKRLDMGYELDVKSVRENSGDLFEVRLIDTRRKEHVNVGLPDVGYGISQLLPFIVQSLLSEKQIISIEQPEVHVHPKLQADLGDLLAECIKEPRQNQFIVETHSEHLILRLQRLVYKREIKPEDVSVIYVSRGPEGAKAERLRLDDEGDFIDEWPSGFFLERLRELR